MMLRKLRMSAVMGIILVLPSAAHAQPTGRLLVPRPPVDGQYLRQMHEYDLGTCEVTCEVTLFPRDYEFPMPANHQAVGPDGLLYVALGSSADGVYKLDPVTGETLAVLSIPTAAPGLLPLPNGDLLLHDDNIYGPGKIWRYGPNGADLGMCVDEGSDIVRTMRLTPKGTVAFIYGHAGYNPTKLVEYDLDCVYLRDVIAFTPDGMYGWDFASDTEILVQHRVSQCIKRYNWATGAFISDFFPEDSPDGCPSPKISANSLVVHPTEGAVYSGHVGGNGCLWGWDADGIPLYGGDPLGCYGNPFYGGNLLILPASPAIPAVSEWGLIVMSLLLLMAGTVVFRARRTATAGQASSTTYGQCQRPADVPRYTRP